MTNPVSSTHASNANQIAQPAVRPPQTQSQAQPATGSTQAPDTAKLKSTGTGDHDGDKT